MNHSNSICPICGNENSCAHSKGQDHFDCWCQKVEFTKDVYDYIKKNNLKGCICRKCFDSIKKDKE